MNYFVRKNRRKASTEEANQEQDAPEQTFNFTDLGKARACARKMENVFPVGWGVYTAEGNCIYVAVGSSQIEREEAAFLLAQAIEMTAALFEASYDHAQADKACAEAQRSRESGTPTHVDYSKFQSMDLREAAKLMSGQDLCEPVYLLLTYAWNDSLDWAKTQDKHTQQGANVADAAPQVA